MIAPHTIIGGRYRVVKALGGGGMKLVYLAEDLRLAARKCALAEMVDSFTSAEAQQQAISAFQREADMLAQLSNEHIPRVFDRFSEGNHHFLVMEYIDGTTLEEQIKQHGGKLPPEQVVEVALQVLDTLGYLHHLQPPVIYRDLKPSNIMVTSDGQAKLIDFGIARHFQPLSNATMIGTQGYAPPEQYRGKVETRSDIYALGATMHHAISGRDPAAEAPFSFPPLQKLCPDIDARLASTIDQALAYDVARRLPDAAEFKHRLLQLRGDAAGGRVEGHSQSNHLARAQLKLPPGDSTAHSATNPPFSNQHTGRAGSATPGLSPGGPTVLSATSEITCPQCTRRIPADSHFCSYCASDLRLLSPLPRAASPNDETVVLSGGYSPENLRSPNMGTYPPANPSVRTRRHGLRRPFLVIALIFAVGFIAAQLIKSLSRTDNPMPPGYSTGSDEGADAMPPAHAAIPPGEYSDSDEYSSALERSRLAALRTRLDAQGYSAVKFRLEGDTLILYGNVPTEYDRLAVQAICFATVGLTSLSDDLTVSGADSED
ncbi:MAG: protein kinase [Deltaproteobacteria bacterium]|nr:protein kinase [Deltaproteobacteria bacterium]